MADTELRHRAGTAAGDDDGRAVLGTLLDQAYHEYLPQKKHIFEEREHTLP